MRGYRLKRIKTGNPDDKRCWGYQGENLKVFYAGRLDLIHFKLYAAIDQFGSYHASDLKALNPSEEELFDAMKWAITHDPSEGFRVAAQMFLKKFGYEQLAEKI